MYYFRFIIENAALVLLPFAFLRKKPGGKQMLLAFLLIISQVFLRQITQFILGILFDYRLLSVIIYLVLSVITNIVLIYGVYFVLTRKFAKPEKPLFIAMVVYILVSLIGAIFSTITAWISYGVYSTSEPSIMQIIEVLTHQSAGIYSQLSNFFNGKFIICLIQTLFVFFLVKSVKKQAAENNPSSITA
jgi:hypothetical protein